MKKLGNTRELLKLLSERYKLRILTLLKHHDQLTLDELSQILSEPKHKVAKHLDKLKDSNLVKEKKVKNASLFEMALINEREEHNRIIRSIINELSESEVIKKDLQKAKRIKGN